LSHNYYASVKNQRKFTQFFCITTLIIETFGPFGYIDLRAKDEKRNFAPALSLFHAFTKDEIQDFRRHTLCNSAFACVFS
jgi:hypothetical protein